MPILKKKSKIKQKQIFLNNLVLLISNQLPINSTSQYLKLFNPYKKTVYLMKKIIIIHLQYKVKLRVM